MTIQLQSNYGAIKTIPTGFSWTTLFFGFFVPLFRGDVKYAIIMLLAAICTMGISNLIFPFFYNSTYIRDLLEAGWRPRSQHDADFLRREGFIA